MNTYRALRPAGRLKPLAVAIPALLLSSAALAQGGRYQSDDAWSFGVTADTQWTITHSLTWEPDDPYYAHVNPNYREENPNYVSVASALKLNQAFIGHGVDFVVQLGDLTDRAGNAAMYTHAEMRQPLYDAGIGFFPVRGNHETYGDLYGLDPDSDMNVPAWRDAFPQTRGQGPNLFGAHNFDGPDVPELEGLSYSFDFGKRGSDARFVFVDIEPTHYRLVEPEPHPEYGLGYTYLGWVVYLHDQPVNGATGVIQPGEYFRIDSSGNASTDFYGFEVDWPFEDYTAPQVPTMSSAGTEYRPGDQQEWVADRLEDRKRPEHAFVLTHRNLMGQNHVDTAWGNDPSVTPDAQNLFYRTLQETNVGYFLSAHDHMHHRSIVRSPDGNWSIEQLIASSSDPKFYSPSASSMAGTKWRETPISQELNNIGYYVFTVDGARVNVDYYSDRDGNFGSDYCWPDGYPGPDGTCRDPRSNDPAERLGSFYAPDFRFEKKENWGYGLNGERFIVPQGISYAGEVVVNGDEVIEYPRIEDSFRKTRAAILDGFNGSDATDNIPEAPRALSKTVTTGWVKNPDPRNLRSDIFSLWGMAELGVEETDVYVLSMTYDAKLTDRRLAIGTYVDGKWVNAVEQNFGGVTEFVEGPYVEGKYELGTYGIDKRTNTAWAVLNYNADFAVAEGIGQATKPQNPIQVVVAVVVSIVKAILSLFRW